MSTTSIQLITLALIILTSSSAMAFGPMPHDVEMGRYEYNRPIQLVAGAAGAAAGGMLGVTTGLSLDTASCALTSGHQCSSERTVVTMVTGGVLGSVTGAIVGTTLTGGAHTTQRDRMNLLKGSAVGLVIGAPLVFMASTSDDDELLRSSILLGGALVGVGAVVGYQWDYEAAGLEQISIVPVLSDDQNGFMVSGRF